MGERVETVQLTERDHLGTLLIWVKQLAMETGETASEWWPIYVQAGEQYDVMRARIRELEAERGELRDELHSACSRAGEQTDRVFAVEAELVELRATVIEQRGSINELEGTVGRVREVAEHGADFDGARGADVHVVDVDPPMGGAHGLSAPRCGDSSGSGLARPVHLALFRGRQAADAV